MRLSTWRIASFAVLAFVIVWILWAWYGTGHPSHGGPTTPTQGLPG